MNFKCDVCLKAEVESQDEPPIVLCEKCEQEFRNQMNKKEAGIMKHLSTLLAMGLCALMVGCASPRTKWTDKNMRVMIDPASIEPEHYVRIQHALVKSDKFVVVDRAQGLQAIKNEQEMLHRKEVDRFQDREKWAHWGKLFGVGGIIVAKAQCSREPSMWGQGATKLNCLQYLAIMDANTGEVITTAEAENDGPTTHDVSFVMPSWEDAVEKLISSYPKNYKSQSPSQQLSIYQDVSKEEAQRQKEQLASSQNQAKLERSPAQE